MKARFQGFTLIELMIVVAIVGILAAVAMPAYSEYVARSQASEAFSLMTGGKVPLAEWRTDRGVWPSAAESVMSSTSGKYTNSIQLTSPGVDSITLEATMRGSGVVNSSIAGTTILLSTTNMGKTWVCSSGTIDGRYLPQACR